MSTSNVDIANIALRLLGEPPITSLTGTDAAQVLCAQALPFARDEVFSKHQWSTLITRKLLNSLPEVENLTDFQYVYSQPADSIRIIAIKQSNTSNVVVETNYFDDYSIEDSQPYIVESGNIYTDVSNAYVIYIRREENPAVLPPYLAEAVAANIAKRISFALTQNAGISQFATQNFFNILNEAIAMDAKSQRARKTPPVQWGNII